MTRRTLNRLGNSAGRIIRAVIVLELAALVVLWAVG
jgi:hypothetical protein